MQKGGGVRGLHYPLLKFQNEKEKKIPPPPKKRRGKGGGGGRRKYVHKEWTDADPVETVI